MRVESTDSQRPVSHPVEYAISDLFYALGLTAI